MPPTTTTDATDTPPAKPTRRPRTLKASLNSWLRWLHTYISMFSLLLILFFAGTGVTLNHPDWTFGGVEKQQQFSGSLPAGWQKNGTADALSIAEFLRAKYGLHGIASDFQYQGGIGGLSFRTPGYSADVQFDQSGKYSVNVDAQGALAVANDFHRGKNSGGAWLWFIDASGIFLMVVALTGLGIMLYLRKVRTASLISIVVGGAVMGLLMWRAM
ncbi:peptidase [Deinococcus psychrotolerans]|uniref:Peptidase n=1 Tax=Deinococcus psychrotolerans TaxID=2489213 RepID=A0A3G8YG24_9DEIO|nr:PepSY-associated TM helix domain-containing protein [Deinococcus psychrotolerans]AZI41494.1 peptidase [Deinococcus psychrotolerans]